VLDYLARPPSLADDPDAYAVEIVGESMAPRFEPGERAFVSPKARVGIGDDVIVQLRAVEAREQLAYGARVRHNIEACVSGADR
jgi:phage repressor protein C with HTH and peptisase S24 domain